MKKNASGKIKNKLLLYSIILVIIPVLMLSYISINTASNLIDSNKEAIMDKNMGILNERFESTFVEFDVMTSYTANLNVVKDAVKRKDKEFLSDFAYNLKLESEVDLVAFTDTEGNIIQSSSENNVEINDYVKKLLKDSFTHSFEILPESEALKYNDHDLDGDALVIFALAPVYYENEVIGSVVYVDIINNENYGVEKIKESTNDEASIYLGDTVISTTITENGEYIVGKKTPEIIYGPDIPKSRYFGVFEYLGERYISKYAPISNSDGEVIGMLVVNSLESPFIAFKNKVIKELLFAGIYAMLSAVFIAFIISSSITKPILKLKESVEIFKDGNYKHRADIKTGDEIEELADSFNHMAIEVNLAHEKLKERAERIEESYDELKDRDKLKTELLSAVSHELRTPLTSIKGYLELLREGAAGKLTETQKEFIEVVYENVNRLRRHVENIKDLVKVDSLENKVKLDGVNIKNAVSEIIDNVKNFANEKNVVLLQDIDNVVIKGDRIKINQVLENLVENAISFTKPYSKVTVGGYTEGENFHLEVTDQGVGIPKEELNNIFKDFYSESFSSKVENVGDPNFGLIACKKIIEAHEGSIWVESRVGKGTTIHVLLPIYK
ncbi:integral membrane sensor signal transduction histidine kinase [Methanococcus vannielii SB]|jgi:two-component system OmpR family sensor kinase|uniref:histidine kinase n=1 Tax=Methanococcus vannielii (strain ATCC 35089 / DSM 1224 / JCM 13029 / OCM 148 / SB) TaxID=406327 RepID=A6UPC9_METVS|nr:ATP-binding protein [Methanococcus vannielii]ABR54351.1 integral membrane sensor signal transduction histidine kinase [Methanococcus vannielii SB]